MFTGSVGTSKHRPLGGHNDELPQSRRRDCNSGAGVATMILLLVALIWASWTGIDRLLRAPDNTSHEYGGHVAEVDGVARSTAFHEFAAVVSSGNAAAASPSPLVALANVRLLVQVSGLTAGATAQLWSGANTCSSTDTTNLIVYDRRSVAVGATTATLDVPACCTPAGVMSVCVRTTAASAATPTTQKGHVVLADLQHSPAALTLPASTHDTVRRLTLVPGLWGTSQSSSSDFSSSLLTPSAWTPQAFFCADAACEGDAPMADVDLGPLLDQLNASFIYWELSPLFGGLATSGECLPASKAYRNPQFLQANISVTYNAIRQRWWVYADVDLSLLYTPSSPPSSSSLTLEDLRLLTCVAPISSATTGTSAGDEYAGHTSAGWLTLFKAPTSSSSSSSSSNSSSSSSSSSSSRDVVPVPPTNSSSSSSSSPTSSSSSSSKSSANSGNSGSRGSEHGGSGSGGGSSSGDGGLFGRSPSPTSLVKGQAITVQLMSKRSTATQRKVSAARVGGGADRKAGGPSTIRNALALSEGRTAALLADETLSSPAYVSVVAADASCTSWLSLPAFVDSADAALHEVPSCGSVDVPSSSSSASASSSAEAAALRALQQQGNYTASDNISTAVFCLASMTVPASATSGSASAGVATNLVWHALGSLELLTLFNCTTQTSIGITVTSLSPATPVLSADQFGVAASLTATVPWISAAGGSDGCAATAASTSFAALQAALTTQGYLTPENTTPTFFVCVRSVDGTLVFTTSAPTLTVKPFMLHPRVAVWGVPQRYVFSPSGVLPHPNSTAVTFSNTSTVLIEVDAAAVVRDTAGASLLLGNDDDKNGTFMSADLIGIYRLRTFGAWVTAANPISSRQSGVLSVKDEEGAVASLLVVRPPVITYTTYTTPPESSSSSSVSGVKRASSIPAAVATGAEKPIGRPARVPAGALVCATTRVPGNFYSQVPGNDCTNASYAAYWPYYYTSEDLDTSSASSFTSSEEEGGESGVPSPPLGGPRGMYLHATTPSAWQTSHTERGNLCSSSAATSADRIVYLAAEGDEVCFPTASLAGGPSVLYVVCAGTPAGYAEAETSALTLATKVSMTPSALARGETTLVRVWQLPNTRLILVPNSDSVGSSPAAPSFSSSSERAADVCEALTASGAGEHVADFNEWPSCITDASGRGYVTVAADNVSSGAAASSGNYTACFWWPDVTASSSTSAAGAWVLAVAEVMTYAPVFYGLSSSVLVAPLVSTVALLQNLTSAELLEGFYTGVDCRDTIALNVLDWSAVEDGTGGAGNASSSASAYSSSSSDSQVPAGSGSRLIEVNARAVPTGAVYLCARVAVNASIVPVVASGLRVVQQPFHIPSSTHDVPFSACSEVDVYVQNSTGLRSGTYLGSLGDTAVRVPELQESGLAELLKTLHADTVNTTTVQVVLTLGACCAEKALTQMTTPAALLDDFTAYGVWVGAGTFGYLLNDTTVHNAAAALLSSGMAYEGIISSSAAVASDVRIPWSVCVVSTPYEVALDYSSGNSNSSSKAEECAMVGRMWVGSAAFACNGVAGAGAPSTQALDVAAAATARSGESASPGVLPLVTSLATTRVNVFRVPTLPTRYTTPAWYTILAGSVLCGAYLILLPLVIVLPCGVLRERHNRHVQKRWENYGAAHAGHTGDEGEVESGTRTPAWLDEEALVDVAVRDSAADTPASAAAKPPATQRGRRSGPSSSSIAPHTSSGWWVAELPASLRDDGASDVVKGGLLDNVATHPTAAAAVGAAEAPLSTAQLREIEEWLTAPSRGRPEETFSMDLGPADLSASAAADETVPSKETSQAEVQMSEHNESRAAPQDFASAAVPVAVAVPVAPSSAGVFTDELYARRVLTRAEEAAFLSLLETEQQAWRTMLHGEGVRLRSLLVEDPYWAPRLAELEVVNRSAIAATAGHAVGDTELARGGASRAKSARPTVAARVTNVVATAPSHHDSDEEDGGVATEGSDDSVRLYVLPRSSHHSGRATKAAGVHALIDEMKGGVAGSNGKSAAADAAATVAVTSKPGQPDDSIQRSSTRKKRVEEALVETSGSEGDKVVDLRQAHSRHQKKKKKRVADRHVDVALALPPPPEHISAPPASPPASARERRAPANGTAARLLLPSSSTSTGSAVVANHQVLLHTLYGDSGTALPHNGVDAEMKNIGSVFDDDEDDMFSASSASTRTEEAQAAAAAAMHTTRAPPSPSFAFSQ